MSLLNEVINIELLLQLAQNKAKQYPVNIKRNVQQGE